MYSMNDRPGFLRAAIALEGALILIGIILAWLFPLADSEGLVATLREDFRGANLGWGVLATIPLGLLFLITYRFPVGPLKQIRTFLENALGPVLRNCRWYHLLLVAALAGFCEEFLFRAVLQPRLGLVGSNVLFALAHFITPTYALLAGLLGAYLGMVFDFSGYWSAAIAHTLYDWLAFSVIAATLPHAAEESSPTGETGEETFSSP